MTLPTAICHLLQPLLCWQNGYMKEVAVGVAREAIQWDSTHQGCLATDAAECLT